MKAGNHRQDLGMVRGIKGNKRMGGDSAGNKINTTRSCPTKGD